MFDRQKLSGDRQFVGKERIHFDEIPSTNSWLLEHPELLQQEGMVITASKQTAGRGRQNRVWEDVGLRQLFCSIAIQPKFPNHYWPSVTLLVGLATYRAMYGLGVEGLSVKWPNDLLIEGMKVCGILCEMKWTGGAQPPTIVAGIGVNLSGDRSNFPAELRQRATTIQAATGTLIAPESMLEAILDQLDPILAEAEDLAFRKLFDEWEGICSSLGKSVLYQERQTQKKGTIQGLSDLGHLIVRSDEGDLEEVVSGEVLFQNTPS